MKRGFRVTQKSITNKNKTKSFSRYLNIVSNIPMFESAEAELECAFKASKGDQEALNELVTKNLRFVISVANKYESKSATVEDLVNQGNIGLQEAALKFDPTKGFKFISYAVWYIRKEMLAYLANNARLVRLPLNRINEVTKFKQQTEALAQELNRIPDINDLYGKLDGFSDEKIETVLNNCMTTTSSLDRPIDNEDCRGATMIDFLESDELSDIHDKFENDSKALIINKILHKLTEKERLCLIYSFGLNDTEALGLKCLSKKLKITSEGTRLCMLRAIKKLKTIIQEEKLDEDLF